MGPERSRFTPTIGCGVTRANWPACELPNEPPASSPHRLQPRAVPARAPPAPRVSRIPTSAVIAAGVAAVIASVGGLIALASGGTADADDGPTPTLGGETAAESQPSIVAGSRRATGVMVDAAGVAIVAMDDPPEQATLIADGRRAPVTLRSADRRLALAAYQVDAADDPDGAATVGPTTLAATGQARESGDWALPTGTPDMNGLTSEWVPSDWGRILVADLGQRNVPPGTELTDRGRLLGLTTRTSDDRTMAVPWPVLRSSALACALNRSRRVTCRPSSPTTVTTRRWPRPGVTAPFGNGIRWSPSVAIRSSAATRPRRWRRSTSRATPSRCAASVRAGRSPLR